MMIRVCPKGHRGSFCDNYCRTCGKQLVEEEMPEKPLVSLRCANENCKAPMLPDDRFCGACGGGESKAREEGL